MTNQKHISELAHDFRNHRVLREPRENITVQLFGISFIRLIVLLLLQKFWNVGYSIRFTVNYDSFSTSDFASFESSQGNLSFCQLQKYKHHWISLSLIRSLWELMIRKQCIYFVIKFLKRGMTLVIPTTYLRVPKVFSYTPKTRRVFWP